MTVLGATNQFLEILLAIAAAPGLLGWVNQCRAWLQNRRAPSLWQPYRGLYKLFHKDAVIATNASVLFRLAPYVTFGTMVLAAAIIPSLGTRLPLTVAADGIALVGLLALARVVISLAAMDVGTAFGAMGARREMMVGFLAEPALLMTLFVAALISQTTSLPLIAERLSGETFAIYPSLAFTAVAFTLVSLAENARIPVDNPATHLELTMIHEAMILEYSGRHLALMDWAAQLKLMLYGVLLANVFLPWGIAQSTGFIALSTGLAVVMVKLALLGTALAVSETVLAKMRLFRVPAFLNLALLLALLGLLSHVILEVG